MSGRVTLVGGGPGDADLLTIAAVRALATADVVLYDRLAPHEALADLAPGADLVDVGKRPGHHALPQSGIEALLVEHARAGRHAVRLKGGDPYVLGRGGEEVLACRRAGVPVAVVPGITSAIAVPAAAGIPLTHRGVSHLFTVVSGHAPLTEDELRHLAQLGGTLVVLMGVGTLPMLASGLARHGLVPSTPVAIIERGHRPDQRTTIADLGGIVTAAGVVGVASPAVVVVGEVVRLAHDGDRSAAGTMARAAALAEAAVLAEAGA
ncbi:uroporphyrinogen-III C-methyltransferase [Agromyces marinus]|uniref:uroporphyrinogen-III C-methyltransferase n=1 Tax=Agromyces marinus TaxID=1389020 RepID=UPI001F40B5BB|nr:uroporphyrinogen-III C-methyltransferase [Agromyces marinus]UIP58882.1 Uroporphyrinogen-III C-methyltransferase [Agromyces marinus]